MKPIKIGVRWLQIVLMTSGMLFILLNVIRMTGLQFSSQAATSQFKTQNIENGNMEIIVSCSGTLQAVGTVEVGAEVSGTIENVLVDYNDQVKKGQIIAELDLDLFQANVSEARAQIIRMKALLKQAKVEYERNKLLFEQNHLSAQELLQYETEVETARADLMSAEASLKKAQTNLQNAKIRSPIDGTVIARAIEEGQTVASSYSTPTLFIIAEDLSNMKIEAEVDESDIGLIKKGQTVRFTVQSYPDALFTGTVSQIRLNPAEDSNVVIYTVIVKAPNEKGMLLPGMTATIDFIVEAVENVLMVPNAALRFKNPYAKAASGSAIFILDDKGLPVQIAVKTGISDGIRTVVEADSISAGMQVVTGQNAEKTKKNSNLLSKLLPRPPKNRRMAR